MAERVYDSPPATPELFARAAASMIPGASRLPFIGGRGRDLPALTLSLPSVRVERDRLAAYCRVCAMRLSDTLPPTYPHILAFPLQLALLTDPSFPFSAVGLVQIANEITQRRRIDAAETLSLRVWASDLEPHPRGQRFSLRTEAAVAGEVVWEEVSVNLRRGGASGQPKRAPERADGHGDDREREPLPATARWRLPADLGRRYAAVSGDFNPIHLHPLSARLFGFPSAIAHGMWTKARCLAALEPRLPAAFTVAVSFRAPIVLPTTVEFAEAGERFAVRDAARGTPHLDGSLAL